MDINQLLAIGGLLTGVLGVYYGWSQNRQGPARLRYDIRRSSELHISSGSSDKVGITYAGTPVSAVSTATVGFLNCGKQRINVADVERPVQVVFNDESVEVLQIAGPGKEVSRGVVEIAIAPLSPGERRHLSIVHTGEQNTNVTVTGGLANLPLGIESPKAPKSWREYLFFVALLAIFEVVIAIGIIGDPDLKDWNIVLLVGFGVLALPVGLALCLPVLVGLIWILDEAWPKLWKRLRGCRESFPSADRGWSWVGEAA